MKFILKVQNFLKKCVQYIVSLFLVGLISVSFIQVVLRKFFNSSIPDGEMLITMFVFYIALFGGALATLYDRHIHVEVLTKFLSKRMNYILSLLSYMFSILVLYILFDASLDYIGLQKGSLELFMGVIPVYCAEAVIVPCFVLMVLGICLNMTIIFYSFVQSWK